MARKVMVGFPLVLATLSCATAARAAASDVEVAIEVFSCSAGAPAPELWISNIAKTFAKVSAVTRWSSDGSSWKTMATVPEGHYIVHSGSKQCSGGGQQWVAVSGERRHVTITLNKTGSIVAVDENMYAAAVYGILPSADAQVEIMSADSIIGEQTRRSATIDGNVYQIGHLEPGEYVLRILFGSVVASREVTIPLHSYGATVRADLTRTDAAEIVKAEAQGSGFVPVQYNGTEPMQTFHLGSASVDGWQTEPLLTPSDYNWWEQRISASSLAALAATQRFLNSDNRIPERFRSLSDWSVKIQSQGYDIVLIDLFPVNSAEWQNEVPKTHDLCIMGIGRGDVFLRFDNDSQKMLSASICP